MARCPACETRNPRTARYCNGCGRRLVEGRAPASERRKLVTVLFIDLVGSTALGERLDPETVREVLTRYFDLVRVVVDEHGGTVEKFIGDAALAVFGVPIIHEDDALRAIRAAMEVRRRLPNLNQQLQAELGIELMLRTGIASGEVMADESGLGPTLVTGDAVNTAARIEQGAKAGEILIGKSTWQLAGSAAVVEPHPPISAKGKAAPVEVGRLVDVADVSNAIERRSDTPFVGRETELAQVGRSFERASINRSAEIVTIIGDAGVGKSRLVHEFLGLARSSATVLRGSCLPYGRGITWWPLGQIVRAAAGVSTGDGRPMARRRISRLLAGTDDAAEVARVLASLIGMSDEPVPDGEAPRTIRRLLERLARDRPLVIAVDDIQWAEPAFLDALDRAISQIRDLAVLVVAIARPDLDQAHPGWVEARAEGSVVRLDALDESSVLRLLEAIFGGLAIDPALVQRITLASEGNPLFVEQVAGYLLESGAVRREGDRFVVDAVRSLAIPPTITGLMTARLDRLSRAGRHLAGRGSVIGREFDEPGLGALTPTSEVATTQASIAELLDREILLRSVSNAETLLRFRHLLLRDAAYAAMPKRERGPLHERFATWLEETLGERLAEALEIVGYHLEQAHRLRAELGERSEALAALGARAGAKLLEAGEAAWNRNDAEAAGSLLRRAGDLLPNGRDRAWALLILGRALNNGSDLGLASNAYEAARHEATASGDPGLAARVAVHETGLLMRTSPDDWFATGMPELRRLEGIAREHGNQAGVAWALFYEGIVESSLGRLAAALRLWRRATPLARQARDAYLEGRCLSAENAAAWTDEPIGRGIRRCQRVSRHPRADRITRAESLENLGLLYALDGELGQAVAACNRAMALVADLGTPDATANAHMAMGQVLMWHGDWAGAAAAFESALGLWRANGDQGNLSYVLASLGRADVGLGRIADALALAEELREIVPGGDLVGQADWRAVLALASAKRGDPVAAEELLTEAASLRSSGEDVVDRARGLLDLADARIAVNDQDGALAAATDALRIYERKQARAGIDWAMERLRLASALA